jgi:hypothetical protein
VIRVTSKSDERHSGAALALGFVLGRESGELLVGPENLRFAAGELRKTRMDVAVSSAPVEKTA